MCCTPANSTVLHSARSCATSRTCALASRAAYAQKHAGRPSEYVQHLLAQPSPPPVSRRRGPHTTVAAARSPAQRPRCGISLACSRRMPPVAAPHAGATLLHGPRPATITINATGPDPNVVQKYTNHFPDGSSERCALGVRGICSRGNSDTGSAFSRSPLAS